MPLRVGGSYVGMLCLRQNSPRNGHWTRRRHLGRMLFVNVVLLLATSAVFQSALVTGETSLPPVAEKANGSAAVHVAAVVPEDAGIPVVKEAPAVERHPPVSLSEKSTVLERKKSDDVFRSKYAPGSVGYFLERREYNKKQRRQLESDVVRAILLDMADRLRTQATEAHQKHDGLHEASQTPPPPLLEPQPPKTEVNAHP